MVAEISMLGAALKEVLTSGVADKAVGLVSSVKKNLDKDKTISAYENAFTQLIQENHELKTISMGYRDQFDQIYLSEKDIEYLQQTAIRLINLFIPEITDEKKEELEKQLVNQQGQSKQDAELYITQWEKEKTKQRESIEQLVDLIQVDTLRTMQLLGLNYREAIGEPLTELVANSIKESTKTSMG